MLSLGVFSLNFSGIVCAGAVTDFFSIAAFAAAFGSPTIEKPPLPLLPGKIKNHLWKFCACIPNKTSKTPPKFHEKTPERVQRVLRGPRPSSGLFAAVSAVLYFYCFCAPVAAAFAVVFAAFGSLLLLLRLLLAADRWKPIFAAHNCQTTACSPCQPTDHYL